MTKSITLLSWLLATCWLISSCQLDAQKQSAFPADVESRIKQVENGLSGAIMVEGQGKYNLKDRMAFYRVPGLTIAVIHNYKVDWARGYGWADESEKREVTPATLFQAASISKSLNGVGVVKLAQDKKVNLNADINTYLKSWKFPYDSLSKNKTITLTNLLSHTAGLSVHGFRGYAQGEAIPTTMQTLDGQAPANNAAIRSIFDPGLKVQYSGGGTTISQQIVTDVTGLSYDQYMKTNVLQPLGMTTSFYSLPDSKTDASLLATGYKHDGKEVAGKFHLYPENAAASLWTNPTELAKYIIETQLSLKGESAKVLSRDFTKLRLTPHMGEAALGVFIDTKGDEKYFQHGGANEGFRSQYYGNMENGNGVVVMVNSDNGAIIQEVIRSVAAVYQWKDFYEDVVKKIVQLSDDQLKQFEGFYQAKDNEHMYIQFAVKDHQLVLKQLWDGREILFSPESELDFFCKEFPFPLSFTKNQGSITQVLAFNRDVWVRDNDYKPVERKAIQLPSAQLKAFEGKYQGPQNKNLIIQVTAAEDHLRVKQLWDGQELVFVPESDLNFFARDNQFFPIRFIKDNNGEIVQVIAFERDMLNKVKD